MLLSDYLPLAETTTDSDALYDLFLEWNHSRNVTLYPAQDEAVMELVSGSNVIVNTPTGSGKSLIALAAHFLALAHWPREKQRSYYTAPIKALVSEKFFSLIEIFGPDNVGMITGESAVNPQAPILCCTTEILANLALREGRHAAIANLVMDEFHYFSDPQRGWAWQVPLIELPQAQFLLMSATLGDMSSFQQELTSRTGRNTNVIAHSERPIPLHFSYALTPLQETVEELLSTHRSPLYIVHFSQAEAIARAQSLTSIIVANRAERDAISKAIASFRFAPGFGKTLNRLLRHGIGVHHAGMLPKYRRLVEQLAQHGVLRVICGTDTLGVGINVPIRTVVMTALSKFDGTRTRQLQVREFHQIAGRAGRAGYDTAGTVVVQAPEHAIENAKALAKAQAKFGSDEKKIRQAPKKKPPEGFVSWTENTLKRLMTSQPEPLISRFSVNHAMLLNLMKRTQITSPPEDPVVAARRLLTQNREPAKRQYALQRQAIGILREFLATGVIERVPEDKNVLRLTVDLPDDFALNEPLSPFAHAGVELFDPQDPDYVMKIISLVESTLENPQQVLAAQTQQVRKEARASMKDSGLDFLERTAALETMRYPQPLGDLLRQSFQTYQSSAPWLSDFSVEPKSIVRDMAERFMDFGEYVRYYSLTRVEGILLRYLSNAYRALKYTLPAQARTEELEDLVVWLGEIVRQTDSSLLEEWQSLTSRSPGALLPDASTSTTSSAPRLTDNTRAFTVMVRNEMFRRVLLAARADTEGLGALDAASGWNASRWSQALERYWEEHEWIGDGPAARSPRFFHLDTAVDHHESSEPCWRVRQVLDDPAGHHDWAITAAIDLNASDRAGHIVLHLLDFSCSTDTAHPNSV